MSQDYKMNGYGGFHANVTKATIISLEERIAEVEAQNASLSAENAKLQEQNSFLVAENSELKQKPDNALTQHVMTLNHELTKKIHTLTQHLNAFTQNIPLKFLSDYKVTVEPFEIAEGDSAEDKFAILLAEISALRGANIDLQICVESISDKYYSFLKDVSEFTENHNDTLTDYKKVLDENSNISEANLALSKENEELAEIGERLAVDNIALKEQIDFMAENFARMESANRVVAVVGVKKRNLPSLPFEK
jgi:hypothetical protein